MIGVFKKRLNLGRCSKILACPFSLHIGKYIILDSEKVLFTCNPVFNAFIRQRLYKMLS